MHIEKLGILLEPSHFHFEHKGVFNPAVIEHNDQLWMLYRATTDNGISTWGRCLLDTPSSVLERDNEPYIVPTESYEKMGIEDPRIVRIEDRFYITYTAYDGMTARGALMVSDDLIHFERKGILTPQMTYRDFHQCLDACDGLNRKYQRFSRLFHTRAGEETFLNMQLWDKDVVFFPRKINGQFAFLHRIYPDIQLVLCDDLMDLSYSFWKTYLFTLRDHIVLSGKYTFESSYIGAGCPPIETAHGWILIYHGVQDTTDGYVYAAGVALLDLNNPTHELSRLAHPLFLPDLIWEKEGNTPHVVFPVSAFIQGDQLYIYYGAADQRIGILRLSLTDLINELLATIE
jgi:predicted GH43/DUF377 family glycosyl hydrolase